MRLIAVVFLSLITSVIGSDKNGDMIVGGPPKRTSLLGRASVTESIGAGNVVNPESKQAAPDKLLFPQGKVPSVSDFYPMDLGSPVKKA